MSGLRTTVRLRLTLVYGGLFLAAGMLLLAINYALVSRNLPHEELIFRAPLPAPDGVPEPVPPLPPGLARPGEGAVVVINGHVQPATRDVLEQLPLRVREDALDQLVVQSLTALGVMGVASVGLGWVMAGRVLLPLKEMTAKARQLSEENLHERIALQGPDDELKELADTFDSMLGRLDAAFEAQRRFVANASHELRTPLAIMRTEVDVALAGPGATEDDLRAMAERVRQATDRSERLIDSLLTLARSDRGVERPEPLDLADLAAAAAGAAPAGVRVEVSAEPAVVAGDRALLERLVANLVENAVAHNVAGGWVSVATTSENGRARLRVANSGPVVPADQVDSLFEPFRRLSGDRTASGRGAGLGLSIVRSVTAAHGGQVRAAARPEGGLEVTVDLPSAATPLNPPTGTMPA